MALIKWLRNTASDKKLQEGREQNLLLHNCIAIVNLDSLSLISANDKREKKHVLLKINSSCGPFFRFLRNEKVLFWIRLACEQALQ